MTLLTLLSVCVGISVTTCASLATTNEDGPVLKDHLCRVELPDGTSLRMIAYVPDEIEKKQDVKVKVFLYPKGAHEVKHQPVWTVDFTTVSYVPESNCHYALVAVNEDEVFVFSTWNGDYCKIAKRTGRVLDKGKGDYLLTRYDRFLPVKPFLILGPSTGVVVREIQGN